jgi:flagellar motor switch protein FliN/FliY
MALISNIPVAEVAAVTARALEELLGHDVVLMTGTPELGGPDDAILPDGGTRAIVLPFSDGVVGEVTLIVGDRFATTMEAVTVDASLTTAALPALEAGAAAIAFTIHIGVNPNEAGEIATDTLLTSVVGEFAAVPILENDVIVACLVVRIVDDGPVPTPIPAAAPIIGEIDVTDFTELPELPQTEMPFAESEMRFEELDDTELVHATASPTPSAIAMAELSPLPAGIDEHPQVGIAVHEFQPLGDGGNGIGPARPLTLLNDVNMEVTAELGRRRMKVRDIVGLKPGSVVDLDRAAGSPVDVLVNGALVWHGEVVVVDEEFGIRVSEIVVDEN